MIVAIDTIDYVVYNIYDITIIISMRSNYYLLLQRVNSKEFVIISFDTI